MKERLQKDLISAMKEHNRKKAETNTQTNGRNKF